MQKTLSSTLGVWGDPSVIYDTEGNLFFAHLSNPMQGYWIDRIVVQKSTDNGQTWSDGNGIGLTPPHNQDKEWLAVDYSNSTYRNNLYMSWTEFDRYGSSASEDSSRILFSRSVNSGESWTEPIKLSDVGGNCIDDDFTVEGAVPTVGPNGEVYVSWSGPLGIVFDKSLDGGGSFGEDIFVTDQPAGWAFNIPGISRCNGMPITACDISESEYRGNIYINWSDQRNGSSNTDIFLIKSEDGGETWGEVITVNNDETEVYLARSIDGGNSFENFKISETSFLPTSSVFFGDYINIAAYNGMIRPIWMRMDDEKLSVWVALISDANLTNIFEEQNLVTDFRLYQNYPNPFNPNTIISYQIPEQTYVEVVVYDVLGKQIEILEKSIKSDGIHELNFSAESLSSGIYFYKITTGNFIQTRKMIVLK